MFDFLLWSTFAQMKISFPYVSMSHTNYWETPKNTLIENVGQTKLTERLEILKNTIFKVVKKLIKLPS